MIALICQPIKHLHPCFRVFHQILLLVLDIKDQILHLALDVLAVLRDLEIGSSGDKL